MFSYGTKSFWVGTMAYFISCMYVEVCMANIVAPRVTKTDEKENITKHELLSRFTDHSINNTNNGLVQVNVVNFGQENPGQNRMEKDGFVSVGDVMKTNLQALVNRSTPEKDEKSSSERNKKRKTLHNKARNTDVKQNNKPEKCVPLECDNTNNDELSISTVFWYILKFILLLLVIASARDFYCELDSILIELRGIHETLKLRLVPNNVETQLQDCINFNGKTVD